MPDAALLAGRSRHAAFLCYHSVADGGPPFLSLPPDLFERQLALLGRRGWATATSAALPALAEGRRPDRPLAWLTFDDGFADNHETVLPLLRQHGATAMVFVLPSLLGGGDAFGWPEVAERTARHPGVMRSMTWNQVDEMAAAGVEIGSHTLTHPRLSSLGDEQLAQELLDARQAIRERLGRCDVIAYPFGDWDARVAAAAGAAGYRFAFTMPRRGQAGGGLLSLPRVAVDHRDDERRFALKLSAAGRRLLLSPAVGALRSRLRRRA